MTEALFRHSAVSDIDGVIREHLDAGYLLRGTERIIQVEEPYARAILPDGILDLCIILGTLIRVGCCKRILQKLIHSVVLIV